MDYFVQTQPNKGKLKNGDSYQVYEDEMFFIGCVADGVGSCSCDWKASKEICEDFVYYFNEFRQSSSNLTYILQDSLKKAYAKLYLTKGECEGMLSTMVCVVIDKSKKEYFFLGIGDSKILFVQSDKISEISQETDFKIPIDLLPNYVKIGGNLISDTNFVLISDGFWTNRKAYEIELQIAINSPDWKSRMTQLFEINKISQFDDMTVMVIKI
jgi:serine/threonine protein phosphatase PrpC